MRGPQSSQSVPMLHLLVSASGPPSSQTPRVPSSGAPTWGQLFAQSNWVPGG